MKRMGMVCFAAGVLSLGCAGAPAGEGGSSAPRSSVRVPIAAIPQPGKCSIWSPEKSNESVTGACTDLLTKVKAGDWLLTRGLNNSGDVPAYVYGEIGIIRETYLLDVATGKSK